MKLGLFTTMAKMMLPYSVYVTLRNWKHKPGRAYLGQARDLLSKLRTTYPETPVIEYIVDRTATDTHGINPVRIQYWYASNRINLLNPPAVYDVGSHRDWLLGLGAGRKLHTLDVRPSPFQLDDESFHQGQAEKLPWADASIDCLTSLSSVEHFGLGGYGDPFDPHGDVRALEEVKRVLKPGGRFVFTTMITGGPSFIVFNTKRIYSYDRIHEMLRGGMNCVDERFFSVRQGALVDRSKLIRTLGPNDYDLYLADWQKSGG